MGLAVGSLVILSSSQSFAETTNNYFYDYTCKDGLATGTNKIVKVKLSIPQSIPVNGSLQVGWELSESPLISPEDFATTSQLTATGTVGISGLWSGTLDSSGTKDFATLKKGDKLDLPTMSVGSAATSKEGEITVKPGGLKFSHSFTPPESSVKINDAADANEITHSPLDSVVHGPITYRGAWAYSSKRKATEDFATNDPGDHLDDVHYSSVNGNYVTVKFTGTGIEYITERDSDMGPVNITVDDEATVAKAANPSLKADGSPMPVDTVGDKLGQQVVWSRTDLKYGAHTLTLEKAGGKNMVVDAFNVITKKSATPVVTSETTCTPPTDAASVTVKVEKASTSPSPSPSPTPTPSNTNTQPGGTTTTTSTPKPTLTVTATVTPTRPTPTAPQVIITPVGGAQTGEAPDEKSSGAGLLGLGTAMVLGSVFGGVALKRRRAAHLRGQD
ncbi:hypothetical protein SAMN05216276_10837 [Streptosporangium subroseum]|uniref:Uncharacterized protein n=1 Tax=Streptosporangium subroseum TaxID=106412 RepID=A0A239P2R5_9ACTN|nr:hypothetical protein [Streptosporangium subroseum]SNT61300.1 hypothetical protein SAMN05216276_10837 [Streptosporangium subroseum]